MPAATTEFAFRPMLTRSEVRQVYEYIERHFEKTGYHISLYEALERLLRTAIERERARNND